MSKRRKDYHEGGMGTRNAKGTEAPLFNSQSWLIPPPTHSAPLCTPATLSLLMGLLWVSALITSRHRAPNRWPRPCSAILNQAQSTDTNFPWVSSFNLQAKESDGPVCSSPSITQLPADQLPVTRTRLEGKGTVCRKAAGTENGSALLS